MKNAQKHRRFTHISRQRHFLHGFRSIPWIANTTHKDNIQINYNNHVNNKPSCWRGTEAMTRAI